MNNQLEPLTMSWITKKNIEYRLNYLRIMERGVYGVA